MAQRPEDLHRFHAGPSLSHGTLSDFNEAGPEGLAAAVAAQGYAGVVPAVDSVAAQESFGGGLAILVTGTLGWPGKPPSRFAHTFFLARQEKGFFVLNDILRLEESGGAAAAPKAAAAAEKKAQAAAAPERKQEEPEVPAEDLSNLTYAQRLKIAAKKGGGPPVKAPGGPPPAAAPGGAPPAPAGGGPPPSASLSGTFPSRSPWSRCGTSSPPSGRSGGAQAASPSRRRRRTRTRSWTSRRARRRPPPSAPRSSSTGAS